MVVAGAQLLLAVPGDFDNEVAFVGCPGALEPDALPSREVFLACAQQVADPVERVALAAPVAMDLLLHAASHVVDDLGPELHDAERVEHCAGVFELVVDGVFIAAKGVERRDLHPGPERRPALVQPRPVRLAGAARDQIQQPRAGAAVDVAGEVDHAGELLRATPAGIDRSGQDVMPDMFVDAQHGHVVEPCRVCPGCFQQRPDRGPTFRDDH